MIQYLMSFLGSIELILLLKLVVLPLAMKQMLARLPPPLQQLDAAVEIVVGS